MNSKEHWERIYRERHHDQVSWHQDNPARSLELISTLQLPPEAPIIDVGGGASRLVDHLLAGGYRDVTVLDLAGAALNAAQERLGPQAHKIHWVEGDLLAFRPDRHYALWHDRAVFHFLTDQADRERYRGILEASLTADGHAVIATFSPDGPERCSGLEILRYDPDSLRRELGSGFELLTAMSEDHVTPDGRTQAFQFCLFRRVPI